VPLNTKQANKHNHKTAVWYITFYLCYQNYVVRRLYCYFAIYLCTQVSECLDLPSLCATRPCELYLCSATKDASHIRDCFESFTDHHLLSHQLQSRATWCAFRPLLLTRIYTILTLCCLHCLDIVAWVLERASSLKNSRFLVQAGLFWVPLDPQMVFYENLSRSGSSLCRL